MATVRDTIKYLQKNFKPEDHIAIDVFEADDVIQCAKTLDIQITKEQAEDIIEYLDSHKDSSSSWQTIEFELNELVKSDLIP